MALRSNLPSPTDRLRLAPGLEVSPLCLGAVGSPRVVGAAFEAGINFFFLTADLHWPLYEPLRRGIVDLLKKKGRRHEIVVAVAAYVTQPDFCEAPFEEVLEALPALERIDVAIAGGAYGHELSGRLPVYARHRASGFCGVRAIGASFHQRTTAAWAISQRVVDLALIRYNARHTGARGDLFPGLPKKRPLLYNFKSTYGFVPPQRLDELGLHRDHWRPSPADHYRYALSQAELDGILCAPMHPREVTELADALEKGALSEAEGAYLEQLAAADGPSGLRGDD
jgi:hypothetical protein